MEQPAWQIFQWEDAEGEQPPLDGRARGQLRYVGRIIKPEDEHSAYWAPDEEIVGTRFGEGRFVVLTDELVVGWAIAAADYSRREPIFLDIVAEAKYRAREATPIS